MQPRDRSRDNGHRRGGYSPSDAFEHHIRTPLSVIYGHVQLLQRRLDKGHVLSTEDLRRTLGYIDGAARSIEAHLRTRNQSDRRKTPGTDDQ